MKDELVKCNHCGSNLCYEQHIDENTTTWLCMSCGFSTSTAMHEGSPAVLTALETSPELYKDLMFIDENKRAWFPATISVPDLGMVFLDGTSKDNWRWAAVGAVPLTKEDKLNRSFLKEQTHKMDMSSIRYFDRDKFILALESVNFI